DRRRRAVGREVAEAAAVQARRDVRDDVELLARLEQRLLERQVEARGHDQLVRRAVRAQLRRQRGEEAVYRRGRRARLDQRVQLVPQRARALHDGDVLRDAGQLGGVAGIREA